MEEVQEMDYSPRSIGSFLRKNMDYSPCLVMEIYYMIGKNLARNHWLPYSC